MPLTRGKCPQHKSGPLVSLVTHLGQKAVWVPEKEVMRVQAAEGQETGISVD